MEDENLSYKERPKILSKILHLQRSHKMGPFMLLQEFSKSYEAVHCLLDQLILLNIKTSISLQQMEKSDQEEQKGLNASKQHALFYKEVLDYEPYQTLLRNQCKEQKEIQEALADVQLKKQEWTQKYKKLQEVGIAALDGIREKFIEEKHKVIDPDQGEKEEEKEIEMGGEHPYKQWIVNNLNSLRKDLKKIKNAQFYQFQEKTKKLKRELILCIESLQFQDIFKNAGLKGSDQNQDIEDCLTQCNSKFNSLKAHASELNPYEYADQMKSYLQIEKQAKEIIEKEGHKKNEEEKELKINQAQVEEWIISYLQPDAVLESQDESQFLFQLHNSTKRLYVFSIKTKNISEYSLNFTIPEGTCFCHVYNELYIGGGTRSSQTKRISANGAVQNLQDMLNQKKRFPMPYWKKNKELFTLGGIDKDAKNLKEFHVYSIQKDSWGILTELPSAMRGSSATILKNVLYNIGGRESKHCILSYKLQDNFGKWVPLTLRNQDFTNYAFRDATVISNTIVFFGSLDKHKTFLLQKEAKTENLEVKGVEDGVNYARGVNDASFATYNNQIYIFETNSYTNVYKFSLTSGQWTLYS